jgi:hypothetical protein
LSGGSDGAPAGGFTGTVMLSCPAAFFALAGTRVRSVRDR